MAIAGGALHAVAFDPGRKIWAVGGENGGVVLHQAGQEGDTVLRRHLHWALALAFAPDGSRLVSGAADGTVDLGHDDRAPIAAHSAAVRCLAYRSDGRQFASGGADRFVRLWSDDAVAMTLEHDAAVTALAYHPKQPVLATASADGKIQVWDADTGKRLVTMNAGPHALKIRAWPSTRMTDVSSQASARRFTEDLGPRLGPRTVDAGRPHARHHLDRVQPRRAATGVDGLGPDDPAMGREVKEIGRRLVLLAVRQ